jgi:hypothetical protein
MRVHDGRQVLMVSLELRDSSLQWALSGLHGQRISDCGARGNGERSPRVPRTGVVTVAP